MSSINNYVRLLNNIEQTALQFNRKPEEIKLVAVTKSVEWSQVQPIYELGQRDFGESRLQEGMEKKQTSSQVARWHFIGTLQKNKVRKVIENFDLIHSVDTFELAKKISDCSLELNHVTHVLLQSNTSGEHSKHGYSPKQWKECFEALLALPNISIDGLMTMAPLTEDASIIKNCFSSLRLLQEELNSMAKGKVRLHHLSMGMSHDYKIAIAEGATLLRIGSALWSKEK